MNLMPGTQRSWVSRQLQQAQQIGRQRGVRGAGYGGFRMYDDVPSRCNLQTMTTNGLAQAPPDTISHYRAAKSFFDAEAEAAQRQLIGSIKNDEVRIGTPAAGAINSVEISAAHQAGVTRKVEARSFIQA